MKLDRRIELLTLDKLSGKLNETGLPDVERSRIMHVPEMVNSIAKVEPGILIASYSSISLKTRLPAYLNSETVPVLPTTKFSLLFCITKRSVANKG